VSSVIAVLGYSRRARDVLHPVCADRVAHAERLAAPAATVILSGEADVMRAAWAGPEVVFVCDPDARTTFENARNIAAAARRLGARELVLVTSHWHRFRAALLLREALRRSGITLSVAPVSGHRPLVHLAREVACLALLPYQLLRLRATPLTPS
jgi:uncharacterized SAM-binding protein YcdF (DUF218 family)